MRSQELALFSLTFYADPKFDSSILIKFSFKAEMNKLTIMLRLLEDEFVDIFCCAVYL